MRRTSSGFLIFDEVPTFESGVTVRVQESCMAFEGAHVILVVAGAECAFVGNEHVPPVPRLNVEQAKQLIGALQEFVRAAEADELIEPVSRGG
jgi:hypothetical protein